MRDFYCSAVALLFAVGWATCATTNTERNNSASDPANPRAEEAPLTPAPNLRGGDAIRIFDELSRDAGVSRPMHMHDDDTPAQQHERVVPGAVYVCPMHSEVRQPTPGSCPKCGMKLVPIKADGTHTKRPAPSGHEHHPQSGAQ